MKNIITAIAITLVVAGFIFVLGTRKNQQKLVIAVITPTSTNSPVPPPKEDDIIRTFFRLIGERRASEAVEMMLVGDDSQKQAWAVQFNAIRSIKVLNIEPSLQEEWTSARHSYKVLLNVQMNPESASAPIPYYGWESGQNIRFIVLEKSSNVWKVAGIATGP